MRKGIEQTAAIAGRFIKVDVAIPGGDEELVGCGRELNGGDDVFGRLLQLDLGCLILDLASRTLSGSRLTRSHLEWPLTSSKTS